MEKFCSETYYKFFQTLASHTRLAIIDVLSDGPKTASEISTSLHMDQDALLEHTKMLTGCALLHSEGINDQKKYSLNLAIIEPLGHLLALHSAKYCPNLEKCISEEKLKDYMKKEAAKETYIKHE